jgi:histone deacetylase 1/2
VEIDDKMPQHEYYEYFGPDYTVHVAPSNMENKNTKQMLDKIRFVNPQSPKLICLLKN